MSGSQQLLLGTGAGGAAPVYIEDVFQTWLYTGTGATQTITNGVNVSANGGLVWIKGRSYAAGHALYDTNRGVNRRLITNNTSAQLTETDAFTAFNTNGFTLGPDGGTSVNAAGETLVSWTFRKQPNFFDVVTFTSNASGGATVNHSLGSTPGMIIFKSTSVAESWYVWHRSTGNNTFLQLNSTAAGITNTGWCVPTATQAVVANANFANSSPYVAYFFAHDAGGFGLTGTDNVITCGSFTTDGSGNATVNLGYEPQWFLRKEVTSANDWVIFDNMRGWSQSTDAFLYPNSASNELYADRGGPTSTGFTITNQSANATFIYITIRRGPMKTPTSGTSVFEPVAATQGLNSSTPATSSILDDAFISSGRDPATVQFNVGDRLRGVPFFFTQGTNAETGTIYKWDRQTGVAFSANLTTAGPLIMYHFRRAPGFFDVVCYTGTGVARTVTHNLGVAPELIIVKSRSNGALSWNIYAAPLGNTSSVRLNADSAAFGGYWNSTSPTASVFSLGSAQQVNEGLSTFVAYLFASCPGVSKVGSYTGTGALQTINCGFTGGARFVLIKRTDSTGDWYVYDSARGISSGNDPYLLMNSGAAEVTGTNYVDTTSVGFQVTAAAPAGLNANGGTYIFLAIA